MTFNLSFQPKHRSNQVFQSVWEVTAWCLPRSVTDGGPSASRGCLRQFLLLKLVTVLLLPHGAGLPLLVGCMFSLRVLLLLRSPHISTKPSTVLLGRLALTDSLVLLRCMLQLGATLAWWREEEEEDPDMKRGPVKETDSVWMREAVNLLCQQLLDTHHLASLLLLGLLGLEATLVSRWPQQTRRFRTSRWAQLCCSLILILVLIELLFHLKLFQVSRPQNNSSTVQNSLIPSFSNCLRRMLWLVNLWLHYNILYSKQQQRQSFFH